MHTRVLLLVPGLHYNEAPVSGAKMQSEVRMLFNELADLPPGERERIFRERQIGSELRAEVESLLEFDFGNTHCLADCVSGAAEQVLGSSGSRHLSYCGPYRLIRLLGSGGMGAVYLAERTDGEIQQTVAIKLLGSAQYDSVWRDRFLKERRFLASLNHPSIVHVIDAGHTQDGRPYLVMEYVEGLTIDIYCEEIELRDRLMLFLCVCEGVSHAHRHLIIHRDLKPSNILVNGSGQPKLLDFGIAKLLDDTGDPTQTVERLLTPNYASPEQLRGALQTTATDVYSLGAVLYKLLTNRSPHESATHTPDAIALAAGTRDIPPPSRLNPALPADIDYILRKALRAEPGGRYASVDAFADDIRALLESRPVQARSGNAWYRTRKFLRRYWLAVVAAVLIIASLSTGLYIANLERAIAQRRFMDIRQLANKLFAIDAQARQLPGSSKTRQFIVDTSLEYLRRLASDVGHDPEFALEIGNAYMRVARVQGVPSSTNLGQMDQAEKNLQIADEYVRSALRSQPGNRTAILRSAQIAHDRMLLARFNGRNDEALKFARTSAEWLGRLPVRTHDRPEVDSVLATYMNVAQQHGMGQHFDEALRLAKRGTEIAQSIQSRPYLGMFYWVSAGVLQRQGKLDEALKSIEESVQLLDPSSANGQQARILNYVLVLTAQGRILGEDNGVSFGHFQEALAPLQRAFEIVDGAVHQDTSDQVSRGNLAQTGLALADALSHSDAQRALAVYDHVLRHLAEIQNNRSLRRYEVNALARSTVPLRRVGQATEAGRRLDTAIERLRQLKMYPATDLGSEAQDTLRAVADYEAERGNIKRAVEVCDNLLDQLQNPKGDDSLQDAVHLSNAYGQAAALHRLKGEGDLASVLNARRVKLWRDWDAKLPKNTFVQQQLEAALLP